MESPEAPIREIYFSNRMPEVTRDFNSQWTSPIPDANSIGYIKKNGVTFDQEIHFPLRTDFSQIAPIGLLPGAGGWRFLDYQEKTNSRFGNPNGLKVIWITNKPGTTPIVSLYGDDFVAMSFAAMDINSDILYTIQNYGYSDFSSPHLRVLSRKHSTNDESIFFYTPKILIWPHNFFVK